ncbi:MAG: sodium/proton-translocating pyrophosphatase, partial [Gemmatimonadota bacterium]|nr:sodium/proton-translocating pyrophosphatase [Gemmatimonadota bacterium]
MGFAAIRSRFDRLRTPARIGVAVVGGLLLLAALPGAAVPLAAPQRDSVLIFQRPDSAPVAAALEHAAQRAHTPGGEVNLVLPSLAQGQFLGFTGHQLLLSGLFVCALGLLFGLLTYRQVKKLPVHRSMLEVSELIYTTCKAYLIQQGKLLLVLELFIGTIIVAYFLMIGFAVHKIGIIVLFSLIGMAGSYSVAWYGIRINTLA